MMRMRFGLALALIVVPSLPACGGDEKGDGNGNELPDTIFPPNPAGAGYVRVRDCRMPGEHSGLSGFEVWTDPSSAPAYDALMATPPGGNAMPDGAVVVKLSYTTSNCEPGTLLQWSAMEKRAGYAPENGDWYWQEVLADGRVLDEGRASACIACHKGGPTTSCVGFGKDADRDYLCTAP